MFNCIYQYFGTFKSEFLVGAISTRRFSCVYIQFNFYIVYCLPGKSCYDSLEKFVTCDAFGDSNGALASRNRAFPHLGLQFELKF